MGVETKVTSEHLWTQEQASWGLTPWVPVLALPLAMFMTTAKLLGFTLYPSV